MERNPKEKAIQIFNDFYLSDLKITEKEAKKYSSICINKIIESEPIQYYKRQYCENIQDVIDNSIKYWNEVKKEIEKL